MIREAIERVEQLAKQADAKLFFHEKSEPADVYFVRQPDGTLVRHVAEAKPRNYVARSLDGFCAQVRDLKDIGHDDAGGVCVFIGREAVVAVLGEHDRRHFIRLPLRLTEGFRTLSGNMGWMTQAGLLWLLRSTFRSNVHPQSFMPDVKQIKFRSKSDSDTDVGQGRASLGKSVLAEMVGAGGELPEELGLVCPVYEDLGDPELSTEFTCLTALGIDLAEQKFLLKPLPGEVEAGALKAGAKIAERITWRLGELVSSGSVRVFVHSECDGK